ncbi:hypothetical protein F383_26894 [Gossypium arboreum]|uniref:Uncharacterized protein n=1 Tax=Gossypium arboreum TaxID=29729 RepID=A0A0B0PF84_GOSAR|nr:hypothetical protein F383_26894 [Gossypium arboreum]
MRHHTRHYTRRSESLKSFIF